MTAEERLREGWTDAAASDRPRPLYDLASEAIALLRRCQDESSCTAAQVDALQKDINKFLDGEGGGDDGV